MRGITYNTEYRTNRQRETKNIIFYINVREIEIDATDYTIKHVRYMGNLIDMEGKKLICTRTKILCKYIVQSS